MSFPIPWVGFLIITLVHNVCCSDGTVAHAAVGCPQLADIPSCLQRPASPRDPDVQIMQQLTQAGRHHGHPPLGDSPNLCHLSHSQSNTQHL